MAQLVGCWAVDPEVMGSIPPCWEQKGTHGLDVLEVPGVLTMGRIWDDSFGLQAHTLCGGLGLGFQGPLDSAKSPPHRPSYSQESGKSSWLLCELG